MPKKVKVEKSRLYPGLFLCLVFLAECTRLTTVKKWREILGNRGINVQVFICSCTLCVPAMFQDVESLRQNLDGQEIKRGKTKVFNSKQRSSGNLCSF